MDGSDRFMKQLLASEPPIADLLPSCTFVLHRLSLEEQFEVGLPNVMKVLHLCN